MSLMNRGFRHQTCLEICAWQLSGSYLLLHSGHTMWSCPFHTTPHPSCYPDGQAASPGQRCLGCCPVQHGARQHSICTNTPLIVNIVATTTQNSTAASACSLSHGTGPQHNTTQQHNNTTQLVSLAAADGAYQYKELQHAVTNRACPCLCTVNADCPIT